MKISQTFAPNLSLSDSLIGLAESIDNCISKEECYTVLLSGDNYRTIYRETKALAFVEKSLLFFIRSRIALFQMDFIWFQKESIALINLWLAQEAKFQTYFNKISKNQLVKILCFGEYQSSVGFADFFKSERIANNSPLNQSAKDFLTNLKADKLQFLKMARVPYSIDW